MYQRGEDQERGRARGRTLGRGEISDEGALLPFSYGASPRFRAPRPAEFHIGQNNQTIMPHNSKKFFQE